MTLNKFLYKTSFSKHRFLRIDLRCTGRLKVYPEDYIHLHVYENEYKNNENAIRRYIGMLQIYEYLAFTYTLKKLKIPDPLGPDWLKLWSKELVKVKEFRDVHEYHRNYYPSFAMLIDEFIHNVNRE